MILRRLMMPALTIALSVAALSMPVGLVGPIAMAEEKPAAQAAPAGDQKAGDQKPADQKPADQKPADQKTGDQKPGDQKLGEQKKSTDPFGEEITLPEQTIVFFKGNGTWDSAFETITDGFKTVNAFLGKAGIKPAGALMTIYTSTDDTGFQFQAAVPVADAPKDPPKGDLAVGKSPKGRAYKFVHRGSYDSMDTTYEAITNFLDEKGIDAKESFVEQYVTDPLTTPEDKLVVEIYVPIK